VDWSRPASEIAARLRGFTPWPGCFTRLGGRLLKLLAAAPDPRGGAGDAPGTAVRAPGQGMRVACGEGTALLVTRVQLEGKAPQDALAFWNGLRRERVALGT